MTGEHAICIHGHFYQPPRENPWIEAIEVQDSAAPFHDWNERVAAECYAPNTAARILNGGGSIRRIINNYARMSFNIGPTLLSWMEAKAPAVYAAILEADEESRRRFSGHGSAIAQAYSHPILPLANERDKETQILWGLRDFEHRFGRTPEGMWLPETAVDVPTLEVFASVGIRFVLLAPHQVQRVRAVGETEWRDVTGGRADPKVPYRLSLPSGQSIALFVYDGPIAHDVSFGRLLEDGEAFHRRLLAAFDVASSRPQLVHLATDGEVYGHHRRF
jgi:alpha-amylase/alpha-mannosidase (GH57 family)